MLLILVGLAGCSETTVTESQTTEQEAPELEIWMCYDRNVPGSYYVFLWDSIAEEYGCSVTVKTYSQQEIEDKLRMALSCNELPDIFMVPGGAYPEYLFSSGACLALQSYLEEGDFLEEYTLTYDDGNNYLIPCLPESYGVVYYDNSLLTLMQLTIPSTWEELIQLIEAVNAYNAENGTDYAAIEMGGKDTWLVELLYCFLADGIDEASYAALLQEDGEVSESLLLAAAEQLQALMDLDAFPEDYMEIGEAEAVKNFINHDAVLLVHQTSLLYHLTQNMGSTGFTLEAFPVCQEGAESSLLSINSTYTPGLAVSARSVNADLAAQICLDFAQAVNVTNVEEYNYLNLSTATLTYEKNATANQVALHRIVEETALEEAFAFSVLPQETADSWGTLLKRFLAGDLSVDEFVAQSLEVLP